MAKRYSKLVRHPENVGLFKAVEMSILAAKHRIPLHLHAEGLRGTGKTTIIRAAKDILPKIERIAGCIYNCDPKEPHCPQHRNLSTVELEQIGAEWVPMPFLEVAHAAKVATVVGSIDLEKLTQRDNPEAALLPGTLAQAHRGIVFVDEINRLADTAPELADILLDVMGTKPGRLQIEEAGLPRVEMPTLVTIWSASNPDEDPGPLEGIRRQLADRFDLCIGVRRPNTFSTILTILEHTERNNFSLTQAEDEEEALPFVTQLNSSLQRLIELQLRQELREFLARSYIDHGLESIRALEAIVLSSRVHAALAGRSTVELDDLRTVIPMALKHRTAPHVLSDILDALNRLNSSPAAAAEQKVLPQETEEKAESATENHTKAEVKFEEGLPPQNRGFLNRLFNTLREKSHDDEEQLMRPTTGQEPPQAGLKGKGQALLDSSLVDPEVITIVAPPQAAKPLRDVIESRMVMDEEALRRDNRDK